jgi:hypothetical protein
LLAFFPDVFGFALRISSKYTLQLLFLQAEKRFLLDKNGCFFRILL